MCFFLSVFECGILHIQNFFYDFYDFFMVNHPCIVGINFIWS